MRKRVFDICGTILLLIPFLFLFPLIAFAVRLDSPGPVIFRQERVGKGGRRFIIYKFRTLHMGTGFADERYDVVREQDNRVTRVGRILRATKLDELLQLINVLTGDMSLVGPRPLPIGTVTALQVEIPNYAMRHEVQPGLTGPAQINRAIRYSIAERIEELWFDLEYIRAQSLVADLKIIVETIRLLLFRHEQAVS